MAVSEELLKQIEEDLESLRKEDYRRPGMSMNKFIGEYSALMAQAREDETELVAAGFDAANMEKYRGYMEVLSLAHGERMGATPDSPEIRATFTDLLSTAELDNRRLRVVAAHVVESSADAKAARNYRQIAKGGGMIDTATDNIAMAALIKDFPQYASQIRPGGHTVDEVYLDKVKERAVQLLSIRGVVVSDGVPASNLVDRRNRIVTLCLRAQSDIKKYAGAAFFDNIDYYNSNYASTGHRRSGSDTDLEPELSVADSLESTGGIS